MGYLRNLVCRRLLAGCCSTRRRGRSYSACPLFGLLFTQRTRRAFAARFVVVGTETKAFVVTAAAALLVLVLQDERLIGNRGVLGDDQVTQHRIVEAETGLEFLEHAGAAL